MHLQQLLLKRAAVGKQPCGHQQLLLHEWAAERERGEDGAGVGQADAVLAAGMRRAPVDAAPFSGRLCMLLHSRTWRLVYLLERGQPLQLMRMPSGAGRLQAFLQRRSGWCVRMLRTRRGGGHLLSCC